MKAVLKKCGSFLSATLLVLTGYSFAPDFHKLAGDAVDGVLQPDHLLNPQAKQAPQAQEALGLMATGAKLGTNNIQKMSAEDVCHVTKANAILNGGALDDAGRHADAFNDCSNSRHDLHESSFIMAVGASLGRDGVARVTEADLCAVTGAAGVFNKTVQGVQDGATVSADAVRKNLDTVFSGCGAKGTMTLNVDALGQMASQSASRPAGPG